jgi:hypothetical protein
VRKFERETVEGLIRLGKALIQAKHDLDAHGEWLPMLRDDLKLDVSWAQRLMRLARKSRYLKKANLPHLPLALSALMELDRLSDEEFRAGIASGAINPGTTAKQAKQYRTVVKIEKKDATKRFEVPGYVSSRPAAIYRPPPPPSDTERLIAGLKGIEQRLRNLLDGERLKTALDGSAQIQRALTGSGEIHPDENVLPLPGRAQSSQP